MTNSCVVFFFGKSGGNQYGIINFSPWRLTRQRDEPWNHGSNKSPHNRNKKQVSRNNELTSLTELYGKWWKFATSWRCKVRQDLYTLGGEHLPIRMSQWDSILSKAWEYWQENPWLRCYEEGEHCKIYTCKVFRNNMMNAWPQSSKRTANSWKTL